MLPATPDPPTLKNAMGPIAAMREGLFLRPLAPLPVAAVTLAFEETCLPYGSDAGVVGQAIAFTVTEAAPLPTTVGTVSFSYARENVTVGSSAGSCVDAVDSATAHLTVAVDPALQKFAAVASFTTLVDGSKWASSAWGVSGPAGGKTWLGDKSAHRHDLIFAACGPSPPGTSDRGLSVGKHRVELRAELAGGAPIPGATFEIDLRCEGGSRPDGGVVAVPDAAAPELPDSAPTSAADASPRAVDDTVTSGCTCRAGRPGRGGIASGAAAFTLPMLAIRRRRRSLDTTRRDR